MLLKGINDEDFVNYKSVAMFVICHSCTFKCDILSGKQVCQNSTLAKSPDINISIESLVERYLKNSIAKSVVFGGLEPFDDIDNVISFISALRLNDNNDDVVIYTGYTENEIKTIFERHYNKLREYKNIIIKFGRFIPDDTEHYDEVLGVKLQSSNQYAKKIS